MNRMNVNAKTFPVVARWALAAVICCAVSEVWAQVPEPVALWAFPHGRTVMDTSHLGVVAYHQGGVSSVVFRVNGIPSGVVTTESINPETREREFVLVLNTALYAEDAELTIDAVVHASPAGCPPAQLPSRSVWVDNVSTHTSWYVDDASGNDTPGAGTSNAPFATIGFALASASGGDEICVRNGEYDFGVDNNYDFTRFVHIHPDAGHVPAITSAGPLRSGYLHVEGLTFDWTGVETNLPDGGISANMIYGWGPPHLWLEDCTFFGPPDRYNSYLSAVKLWGSVHDLTVERCRFYDVNLAVVAPSHAIVRQNEVGPITSDAFDFNSDILITGNDVYGIDAPHLYMDSSNAQPFDVSSAGALTFHYDEFNSGSYTSFLFSDMGSLVTNPSAAGAVDIAAGFMTNAAFAGKLDATAESGHVRVTARRSNYRQHLYVTGPANAVLGFSYTSTNNEAVGSGQHADVFQTWGTFQSNIVIRNNRAYDIHAQGLLPQVDMANLVFINNAINDTLGGSWMINFEDFDYRNVLLAHNTLWGTRAVMHLQMTAPTDFVAYNNIFGPRGVNGDRNETGLTMDYNLYDYYAPAGGAVPYTNSLWTNPGGVRPSPTNLFAGVTATYDAELDDWEYTVPDADFSLDPDSPARNTGTDACGIAYDINWKLRDTRPDIGAFEYINVFSGLVILFR